MKNAWRCRECGTPALKWMGKCPACDSWGTLEEDSIPSSGGKSKKRSLKLAPELTLLSGDHLNSGQILSSGIKNLDDVLGGGFVPGSLVLLGGEPGIGKSTLLLQALSGCSHGGKTIIVSAEESGSQVSDRAKRLGVNSTDALHFLSEPDLEAVESMIYAEKPAVVAIDSIQTVGFPDIGASPGSLIQVREATLRLLRIAKETGTCFVIVGHITKDGSLAGPKTMEHMVDVVLHFEGDRRSDLRYVRAVKNRFGATGETAFFEMGKQGLTPVADLSALYLQGRDSEVSGSVICTALEGRMPILFEIQALVSKSFLPAPRRLATGLDFQRFILMLAILQQKAGISFDADDVYISAAGGIKISETAADLAMVAALISCKRNYVVPEKLCFFGEIGLAGELRSVPGTARRLEEARKHGFTTVILPKGKIVVPDGMQIFQFNRLAEVQAFLSAEEAL